MVTNAVCPCPETESEIDPCKGSLILDATSAPRWKLSCNECNIVSSFVDTVKSKFINLHLMVFQVLIFFVDVIIQKNVCDCGSVMLKVEFRENQNREPMIGCIMCDDEIENLLATR
jgi:DNA topoisomerase-3